MIAKENCKMRQVLAFLNTVLLSVLVINIAMAGEVKQMNTISGNVREKTTKFFYWEGVVDGRDVIVIKDRHITIKHLDWKPIEKMKYEFFDEFPKTGEYILLGKCLEGRHIKDTVNFAELPSEKNNFTIKLEIDDFPSGDAWYRFELYYALKDNEDVAKEMIFAGDKGDMIPLQENVRKTKTGRYIIVECIGMEERYERYAESILSLCEAAYEIIREVYGVSLPTPITIILRKMPKGQEVKKEGSLYVVANRIYLELDDRYFSRIKHWMGSFTHEMSHMIIHFDNWEFNEGFANYAGCRIIPYIHEKLGDKAWPEPYDYLNEDGLDWISKASEDGKEMPGSIPAAIRIFYTIEQKHGLPTIIKAIREARNAGVRSNSNEAPEVTVEDFKTILSKVVIEDLFKGNGF